MSLSFTRAVEVSVGEKITSAQYNKLARAFNDRLLSGVADGAWRIVWEVLSLVQRIRNRKDEFLFPPHDEWLRIFGLLEADSGFTWPEREGGGAIAPGAEEGLNLINPLANFVYGVSPVMFDEATRLSGEDGIVAAQGATLGEFWEAAKDQRGAFDLNTGLIQGAVEVATRHQKVAYPLIAPYLKTYGGFFPDRHLTGGNCGDLDQTPIFEVIFTHLEPNPDNIQPLRYYGFCPSGTPGVGIPNMLATISYGRHFYYLYAWDGDDVVLVAALPTSEWIEGPYTGGGRLTRGSGRQIAGAINRFVSDFSGSDGQRAPRDFKIRKISFNFQDFFRDQYYLAPQRGVQGGTIEEPVVTAIYPEFVFADDVSFDPDDVADLTGGGDSYDIHPHCVLAGFYVQAIGLIEECTLELIDQTETLFEIVLRPNGDGEAEALHYFLEDESLNHPHPPEEGATRRIRRRDGVQLRAKTGIELEDGGQIVLQLAELLDYKPSIEDAYVVLRLASTTGEQTDQLDTYGRNTAISSQIFADYARLGCIVGANVLAPQFVDPDEGASAPGSYNPVYEAARRLNIENVRLAVRTGLRGYEVIVEDGIEKSVLYYDRYYSDDVNGVVTDADVFRNIAPPTDPIASGQIKPGLSYKVNGDEIVYNGKARAVDETFTGIDGVTHFTGDGVIHQLDGIIPQAHQRGESNRWTLFFSTNVYRPEDPEWQESFFDPAVTLQNRCHFLSTEIDGRASTGDPSLRQHFSPFGLAGAHFMEAPSGYNYARSLNDVSDFHPGDNNYRRNFYRSCQIYQKPYEIESCQAAPGDQVRIKLSRRLSHAVSGTVAKDPAMWNRSALRNEGYRTDENAVRDYILYQYTKALDETEDHRDTVHCPSRTGDEAASFNSNNVANPPFGSCFPRAYFVRLVPLVYEDFNTIAQPAIDTRCLGDRLQMMEKYLRAMCEGYIDGKSTELTSCDLGNDASALFDYKIENLYFDAFGLRAVPILPFDVRGDNEPSYGPLPRQLMYAEIFNCFVQAINKLNKARIELPMKIECKNTLYSGITTVTPDWPPGATCAGSPTQMKAIWSGSPPGASTLEDEGEFEDCDLLEARATAGFVEACNGDDFQIKTLRNVVSYRVRVADPDALELAVPPEIRDLINSGAVGFFGYLVENIVQPYKIQTDQTSETQTCIFPPSPPDSFFGSVVGGNWVGWCFRNDTGHGRVSACTQNEPMEAPLSTVCRLFQSGVLDAGGAPSGDFYIGRAADAAICQNQSERRLSVVVAGDTLSSFIVVPLV